MSSILSKREAQISKLPTRYKKALEVVEAAGGTVSDFALDLIVNAKKNNLCDADIIELLKKHYYSNE